MKFNSRRPQSLLCFTLFTLATAVQGSFAADSISLFLEANGQDIQGESTVKSMGRENSIECLSYQEGAQVPTSIGGMATGKRTYSPIVFTKRIDKSSPLLMKALASNQVIEGSFRFYRPNPTGDGTTQQYFTVEIKGGRLTSINRVMPNALDPAAAKMPATEEIAVSFQDIQWTYTTGGVSFEDTANQSASTGGGIKPLIRIPGLGNPKPN